MPLPHSLPAKLEQQETVCNRYLVQEVIGVGSYGSVYRVRDTKTDVIRALKTVKFPSSEPEAVQQEAINESRLLAQLSHPNIVQLVDAFFDETNNSFHIVMELCSNGTLDEFLKVRADTSAPLSESQVRCWLAQLADALAYIHQRRIIHRDLKAKNIFLCPTLEQENWASLKIGDFGISRTLIGSTDEASTCIGTPYYFSPEVFKHQKYNHKADIWAMGCILYELSSLKHPFTPSDNLPQLMHKVVSKEPTFNEWTASEQMKHLCISLLRKSPKKRPLAKEVLESPHLQEHIKKINVANER